MSTYYRVEVICRGISLEQLREIMIDGFRWVEYTSDVWRGEVSFVGEGDVSDSLSDKECHRMIVDAIAKICVSAKVHTKWSDLDNLPFVEYVD